MRLVKIEWVDSFGCSSNWIELEEAYKPKPTICQSVGWLVYDKDDCKVVVPHITDVFDGVKQGCGDMTIPNESIRSIVDLIESEK